MARRNGRRSSVDDGLMTGLIYTRVSSDEQAKKGLSLPAQLQACRRYAAERGWLISGEYEDVLSGKRDDRRGYQSVLTEARRLTSEGRHVGVVVMRLDRLGRRLPERIRSREEFKLAGVATHSVKEGGEVNDMVAGFLAVLAEEEIERLGDRVRDTREHNEQNGWHLPGRAPLGYCSRPATDEEKRQGAPKSVLVPDEALVPVVREAFRKLASGEATPRGVTVWLAGPPEMLRRVYHSAVRQMLACPTYVGRFPSGERGRWEPLLTDDVWDAAQRRLVTKSRGPVSGNHLLTSVLRCPRCNGRMSGWTTGGTWKRYRCGSFGEGGERAVRNCTFTVSAKTLDRSVLAQVTDLLMPLAGADRELQRAMAREWERLRKPDDHAARDAARLVARARRDAEDARRRIGDAARLLVDGVIHRVAYEALVGAEQQRLEQAEHQLAASDATAPTVAALPPLDRVVADLECWPEILAGETVSEQRAILALLVERAVPVKLGYGRYRAQIGWTSRGEALSTVAQRVS